jgi:hypothetical protein
MSEYFDPRHIDWRAFGVAASALLLVMVGVSLVIDGTVAVIAGLLAAVLVYGNLARGDSDRPQDGRN